MITVNCQPRFDRKRINPDAYSFLLHMDESIGPIVVNSANRTYEWEIARGRSGKSSHVKGLAFDVSAPTPQRKTEIIEYLRSHCVKRIGHYPSFIHFDFDASKPQVEWYGF